MLNGERCLPSWWMLQLVNTEQLTLNGPLAFMTQKPRATETQNIGSVFPNHYLVAHNTHIIQASFTLLSRRNQYDDNILLGAWQMISVTYMSNYSCKYHSVILLQPTTDMHQIKSYFLICSCKNCMSCIGNVAPCGEGLVLESVYLDSCMFGIRKATFWKCLADSYSDATSLTYI